MKNYYSTKYDIVDVKLCKKGVHVKPYNGYSEYAVHLDLDKNSIWVIDENGKKMKWYKRKYGEPVVKLINKDGTIAEKYMSEVEKENFKLIAGDAGEECAKLKRRNDLALINEQMLIKELCYIGTKQIYEARVPFVDFSKPFMHLDEDIEGGINDKIYTAKYLNICHRLTTGEIEFDDLTMWEQALCANRGARTEGY